MTPLLARMAASGTTTMQQIIAVLSWEVHITLKFFCKGAIIPVSLSTATLKILPFRYR